MRFEIERLELAIDHLSPSNEISEQAELEQRLQQMILQALDNIPWSTLFPEALSTSFNIGSISLALGDISASSLLSGSEALSDLCQQQLQQALIEAVAVAVQGQGQGQGQGEALPVLSMDDLSPAQGLQILRYAQSPFRQALNQPEQAQALVQLLIDRTPIDALGAALLEPVVLRRLLKLLQCAYAAPEQPKQLLRLLQRLYPQQPHQSFQHYWQTPLLNAAARQKVLLLYLAFLRDNGAALSAVQSSRLHCLCKVQWLLITAPKSELEALLQLKHCLQSKQPMLSKGWLSACQRALNVQLFQLEVQPEFNAEFNAEFNSERQSGSQRQSQIGSHSASQPFSKLIQAAGAESVQGFVSPRQPGGAALHYQQALTLLHRLSRCLSRFIKHGNAADGKSCAELLQCLQQSSYGALPSSVVQPLWQVLALLQQTQAPELSAAFDPNDIHDYDYEQGSLALQIQRAWQSLNEQSHHLIKALNRLPSAVVLEPALMESLEMLARNETCPASGKGGEDPQASLGRLPAPVSVPVLEPSITGATSLSPSLASPPLLSQLPTRLFESLPRLMASLADTQEAEAKRCDQCLQALRQWVALQAKEPLNNIQTGLRSHIKQVQRQQQTQHGGITTDDAGLVLLWPYLGTFFQQVGLLKDQQFIDEAAQLHGARLLMHIAYGPALMEADYLGDIAACANVLVGLPVETWVEVEAVTAEQQACIDALLGSVIGHWAALKGMPVSGFRELFLLRQGMIEVGDGGLSMGVQKQPQDVLLRVCPWGVGTVVLPWFECCVFRVAWGD